MAKKVSKESLDIKEEKISQLKKLFPEAISEGKIDIEKLRISLGDEVDGKDEKYSFNWAGRKDSFKNIQTTAKSTLVQAKDESVNWDKTENLFIEGDNLEVLKLLQKAYFGKIKMIYIDPPYNTGNDFVYKDNFKKSLQSYLEQTGQTNGEGVTLTTNPETSGRFHSDWISMMYPRLFIARNLLREDGVIFSSIGEDELANLKKISDEVFGEENKIGIVTRVMKTGSNQGTHFSKNTEYLLVYAKNIAEVKPFRIPLEKEYIDKIYTQVEVKGIRKGEKYREMGLFQSSLEERINQRYYIQCPDGTLVIPTGHSFPKIVKEGEKITPASGEGCWRWTYSRYLEEKSKGNISFKKTNTSPLLKFDGSKSEWNVYSKIWLKDRMEEGRIPIDLINKFENRHSAQELKKLDIPFDFAKPSTFISYLIKLVDKEKDDIILDFFAGSGTTAHAVLDMNKEYNENLKFICIQLPEKINEKSKAYKAGYRTIAEISKERIRRVIKKIKKEQKESSKQKKLKQEKETILDLGFKVFKLKKSNYKIWEDYEGQEKKELTKQMQLFKTPLVSGYKDLDVIYECIIKEGYSLNSQIEKTPIKTNKIYKVSDGEMFFYICLDKDIKDKTVDDLKLKKDTRFMCLDNALTDNKKTNLAVQCNLKVI